MKAPWFKRATATFALILCTVSIASACTTVIVGKKATVDGSVMVAQTVDGWYDQRLVVMQGGKHKVGTTLPIHKNICIQTKGGVPLLKVGEIPQAAETYTYFHAGYPFMNEHQLLMGEHTWVGRDENVCGLKWEWERHIKEIGRSVFVIPEDDICDPSELDVCTVANYIYPCEN